MKKILLIPIAIFTLIACNEVFEITPEDKLSENDVWNDPALVRSFMNAIYEQAFEQGLYRTTQIGHATDELHSIKGSVYYYIIQRGELTPDNISTMHEYLNSWSLSYSLIREINIFFESIESSPFDDAIKQEMKGEMKFINAWLYANLIWRYGGVPIITDIYGLDDDDYSVPRDTYDDCVAFIISELNAAIAALPDEREGAELGLASADAARALKARVLLYAASAQKNPTNDLVKWQAAADAAEDLIGTRYTLHSDYNEVFTGHTDEVIFARYFSQANSHDLSMQAGRNGDNGWGSDSPTQNLVDSYEMSNGEFPFDEAGSVNPASGYDPLNPYIDRDPRFDASILHDGSMWMGRETETFVDGMDSRTGPIAAWNGSMSGYYLKKFVQEEIAPVGGSVRTTTPWIMFRYAEILLNYAEASFELGDEATALQYINEVRARTGVNMPAVLATGDDLRKRIQHERRIELVFEGHRYFDVRRWQIADVTEVNDIMGVVITKAADGTKTYDTQLLVPRAWDDKLYWLPIPKVEIDRSLGALTQNPGY